MNEIYITSQSLLSYHLLPTEMNFYASPTTDTTGRPWLYRVMPKQALLEYAATIPFTLREKARPLLQNTKRPQRLQFKCHLTWTDDDISICYEIELSCTASTWNLVGRNIVGPDKDHLSPHPLGEDLQLAHVHVDPVVTALYNYPLHGQPYEDIVLFAVDKSLANGRAVFINGTMESSTTTSHLWSWTKYVVGLYHAVDGVYTLVKDTKTTVIFT